MDSNELANGVKEKGSCHGCYTIPIGAIGRYNSQSHFYGALQHQIAKHVLFEENGHPKRESGIS